MRNLIPELFLVAGFSSIFKKDLLNIPIKGTLNLHAGKLPKYRGGSPLNWQLISGENEAGISVLYMDEGIDSGHLLAESIIPIDSKDTISDLHHKANILFPKLVLETLTKFDAGNFEGIPQQEQEASYWHQRNDMDGKLNFHTMTALDGERLVRALTKPYLGAWATYKNKTVRIYSVQIPHIKVKGTPGRICYIQGKGPYVIFKDQGILLNDYTIIDGQDNKLSHGTHFDL